MYLDLSTYFRANRLALFGRPFRLRRWLYVLTFNWLFWMIWWTVAAGRLLDHVFFPGFRKQAVEQPVFIIANPRSGTTLMHRLMSLDEERFVPFKLYETLFPSILLQKMLGGVAWLDRRIGRPLGRLLQRVERRLFKGWDGIHHIGFARAEEDENLFVLTLVSPGIYLLFPYIEELRDISFADGLPEKQRRRVMRFYKGSLQRHLYLRGEGKVFLNKNTLFCGRIRSVLETFPDARIVYLVRHPYEVVPSFVSMFATGWRAVSPDIDKDAPASRQFADVSMGFYTHMLEMRDELERAGMVTVRYTDLVGDARSVVERVYAHFGWEMGPAFVEKLAAATGQAREYQSEHRYSLEEYGLDRAEMREKLGGVLETYGFEA